MHNMAGTDARKLEVIGAGLPRTGTTSLKTALEMLGYGKCYHMTECFKDPRDSAYFNKAFKKQPVNWKALFEDRGFHATLDHPSMMYYKELMAYYPDAKVVLTLRDPDKWHASIMSTIWPKMPKADLDGFLYRTFGPAGSRAVFSTPGAHEFMNFRQSGKTICYKENAIRLFKEHVEEVKRYVPADKLLVFEVAEGWSPLCKFLGALVPEEPFPAANDAATFQRDRDLERVKCRLMGALALVAIVGMIYAVFMIGQWFGRGWFGSLRTITGSINVSERGFS